MNTVPVKSSNIARVGYEPASKTMEVHFHNGTRYHYHNVPHATHAAFVGAESLGKHFGQHVKPHFKFTKLEQT